MTAPTPDSPLRLAQADWGYIRTSPSSLADGEEMPYEGGRQARLRAEQRCRGPRIDRRLSFSLARPLGPLRRVSGGFAADVVRDLQGLRRLEHRHARAATALRRSPTGRCGAGGGLSAPVHPRTQTDDAPPRGGLCADPRRSSWRPESRIPGPMGYLENVAMSTAIRNPIPWHDRSSGERIDPRVNPLVSPPPNVASVAVYSAKPRPLRRSRSTARSRVLGKASWCCPWSRRMTSGPGFPAIPFARRSSSGWMSRVRWPVGPARRRPIVPSRTYFAYAGDHYSGIRPNGYHYCNGCHTGHTFIVLDPTERTGKSNLDRFLGR